MKIITNLALVFAVITLLFTVMGIISLTELNKIADPIKNVLPEQINNLTEISVMHTNLSLIYYYDNVLTDSARNYALTNDKKWEKLYVETEPKLDQIINDTIILDDENKSYFSNINKSNVILVKMERDSIKHVKNGEPEKAIQILNSVEYLEQKNVYKQELEKYISKQGNTFEDSLLTTHNSIFNTTHDINKKIELYNSIFMVVIPLIIFISLLIGYIVKNSIINPIVMLNNGLKRVSEGDFDAVIKPQGFDEYLLLIKSFNQMTTILKENKKKINETTNQIQTQLVKNQSLQDALDESSIVAITDKKGAITYCNKNFEEISKYSAKELLGQNHRILKSGFHPQEFYQVMWSTISKGKVWRGDIKNKAKDGTFYWVRTTIMPILDENKNPVLYIAIRTDVTEIYTSREKINKQLIQLKEIGHQKDEFISMISHELKSPIFPIIGYCDLLRDPELSKGFSTLHFEAIDEITSNAERLQRITEDLLDVNKMNLGKFSYIIKKFSLAEFMTHIRNTHAPLMEKKQIEFYFLPVEDQIIESDEQRLMQVIGNIIRNAINFVPDDNGKITVAVYSDSEKLVFSVNDNGIGISKENQRDLFTLFYQLDISAARSHGGTGLGLAICKGIVKNLGGKIWVKSDTGKGCTFFFSIPKGVKKKDEN